MGPEVVVYPSMTDRPDGSEWCGSQGGKHRQQQGFAQALQQGTSGAHLRGVPRNHAPQGSALVAASRTIHRCPTLPVPHQSYRSDGPIQQGGAAQESSVPPGSR